MDEYEIDCEECGIESIVHSYDPPEYCPICGSEIEPKKVDKGLEDEFFIED